jgi:uncharacterized protein
MTDATLREKIQDSMKTAMRQGEKETLATIRLMLAAIKQREIDDRAALNSQPLNNEQILTVLDKMIKQRRESILQYEAGNRPDLAEKENAEIRLIQTFLPAQLSEAEISSMIAAAITESGAVSIRDMGKVMAILKAKMQGRADMGKVSAKIRELLGQLN